MTYTEKAIQLSIEGGYENLTVSEFNLFKEGKLRWQIYTSDPLFWQFLMKGLWPGTENDTVAKYPVTAGQESIQIPLWKYHRNRFIDHLDDHDAWSCDILPCDADPTYHYQCDVLTLLDKGWDMMLAFPPCTDLACSGARHFPAKIADGRQQRALDFVQRLMDAPIERIMIENPVGVISTKIRKPDQIIQPYQFGHEAQKTTCLWLKNLPPLKHTNVVGKGEFVVFPSGKKHPKWWSDLSSTNKPQNALKRSRTFKGIADAMAAQWSSISVI